jgi:hypothetical protein
MIAADRRQLRQAVAGLDVGEVDVLAEALAGDLEGVATALYADISAIGPDEIEAMKPSPASAARVATAPTVPREVRAEDAIACPPRLSPACALRCCSCSAATARPS